MNARAKLAKAGMFDKESASACGHQVSKKLKTRIKDWDVMTQRTNFKANSGVNPAYHCPGSQK